MDQKSEACAAAEQEKLTKEASRIVEAVAETGHSPALLQRLKSLESRLEQVTRESARQNVLNADVSSVAIRRFVTERIAFLPKLAKTDPERAKAAFQKHLAPLVLTPVQRESGPVFETSGTWKLVPEVVMPVVARDGIEPPTPAFSGLRSTS